MARPKIKTSIATSQTTQPAYEHPAIPLLREGECSFTQSTDHPQVVQFSRFGRHGNFSLLLVDHPAHGHIQIYTIYPLRAQPPAQFETLRLLNHINLQLPGGAYQLDFSDGQIAFRHCVHQGNTPLTLPVLRQAIAFTTHALDEYLSLINDVTLGNRTCAEALAHHEKNSGTN